MTEKDQIRQKILSQRDSLTEHDRRERSRAIAAWLNDFPAIAESAVLCTYLSKGSEVETLEFVKGRLMVGCRVYVPVTPKKGPLQWSRLDRMEALETGRFGVLEPAESEDVIANPPGGAPVIVPVVASTPKGVRLGYGRGYFDRFLSGHDGLTVGLAYQCQIMDSLPAEPHDVPLDLVVTEDHVYGARSAHYA